MNRDCNLLCIDLIKLFYFIDCFSRRTKLLPSRMRRTWTWLVVNKSWFFFFFRGSFTPPLYITKLLFFRCYITSAQSIRQEDDGSESHQQQTRNGFRQMPSGYVAIERSFQFGRDSYTFRWNSLVSHAHILCCGWYSAFDLFDLCFIFVLSVAGFLMVLDIHFERGFAEVDHRFGDFTQCHFPLFDFVKPLTFQWMCMLYLLMWLGKFNHHTELLYT